MADEYYHNSNQYGYQDALFHGWLLLKNKGARQGLLFSRPCGLLFVYSVNLLLELCRMEISGAFILQAEGINKEAIFVFIFRGGVLRFCLIE